MAKPKSPSAALWRINLSQCPWRSWSWLDNTHCMQKYAAVAEKNKKYCSLRTKFESSNKNNPTDWNWFKEKQKQISLFASFLLESKTVSKKCPQLQIQQRGGWPSWHQFLLGRLFANWPRIIILVLEDFDCDNGDIEIDNDDTKMYLVWLLGSKSSCDQFFIGSWISCHNRWWPVMTMMMNESWAEHLLSFLFSLLCLLWWRRALFAAAENFDENNWSN